MKNITFKKPRSRKEMVNYLKKHFRYDTMSSWNCVTSYARCVKIHKLDFPSQEIKKRAYDFFYIGEAYIYARRLMREFAERYDYRWQMDFNGRSGGYLVLLQGGRKDSGYKSECLDCGQLNYTSVLKCVDDKCLKCGENSRVKLKSPIFSVFTRPGKGVDMEEDFEDWDTDSLRSRTSLVWDFNRTVDKCIKAFVDFVSSHVVEEKEVLCTKTTRVAIKKVA